CSCTLGVVVAKHQLLQSRWLTRQCRNLILAEDLHSLIEMFWFCSKSHRGARNLQIAQAVAAVETGCRAPSDGFDPCRAEMPELSEVARFHNASLADHTHPIGQPLDLRQHMAGQQDCPTLVTQLGDDLLKDDLHQRVESGSGLVEQQQ